MKVRQLPLAGISERLKKDGLILRAGSFLFCIRSRFSSIAESLSLLYADYDVLDNDDVGFVDFYVTVESTGGVHRFIRRNVQFFIDGFAPFNPLPYQHAPALFEWGMNWCVSSKINTYLILHSAVIEKSGRAAILPAPPGSGKSTLTAALIQEGWRLLSDELTLIRIDNSWVVPFPRPVSLKNQSIDIIRTRYPSVILGALSSDTTKGDICHMKPPQESVHKQRLECPVGWIVFPKYEQGANAVFEDTSKGQAFMDVAGNAFNYSRLGGVGFDVLRSIIENAACYRFRYGKLDDAIAMFDGL